MSFDDPGPNRYLCLLPPGVAAALAFENLARDHGNGWADFTHRIVLSPDEDWISSRVPGIVGTVWWLPARWGAKVEQGDLVRRGDATAWSYSVLIGEQWIRCRIFRPAGVLADPGTSTVRRREQRTAAGEPDGVPLLGVVEPGPALVESGLTATPE